MDTRAELAFQNGLVEPRPNHGDNRTKTRIFTDRSYHASRPRRVVN